MNKGRKQKWVRKTKASTNEENESTVTDKEPNEKKNP